MIKKKINSLIKDKTKSNFFIYGLGQSFNLLSPLLIAPLVVAVCGIEGFGKVGLGFALALFLILIVDYSFDVKGTKQVAENRENKYELENILFLAIFTKIILFVFASIIAILLVIFIPFFSQEKHLFLISLLIVFAQIFNPVWFLQGIENFKLVSIVNICSKTLYVLLVFLLIIEKTDYIWVNFYLGFSALIFNLLGLTIIIN
jgi:O-antigen/teichoic acid export membrane protein